MSLAIPQTDPHANYLAHQAEIDQAVAAVLTGGRYILGEQVAAFEAEFAAYLGIPHAVGVGSGTDALLLALRACDLRPAAPVFTVAHTAVATVAAVELAGLTPTLVDIDPASFTMDPSRLEDAIARELEKPGFSQKPGFWRGAIIPVHLYGHPADLPAILEIARRHDLIVIEDSAQAHGAEISNTQYLSEKQVLGTRYSFVGALAPLAAFSFYPTKNLAALGDGGAVVARDAELAERVRLLRQYGWRERYVSDIPGLNSRLDELQAAILRVKLRYLDQENARRRAIAAQYDRLLAGAGLILPQVRRGVQHVYHQYVVRTPQRDALQAFLRERGIGSLVHYPVPVHLQPAYVNRLPGAGALPQTETAARMVLSLPIFPEMRDEQVSRVTQEIVAWARGEGAQR